MSLPLAAADREMNSYRQSELGVSIATTSEAGIDSPARSAFAISPSNSVNFDSVTRGVYVGGNGNIVAVMLSGDVVTFTGVVAGTILPIRATRINLTGTTASNLVGLY